MIDRLIDFSVRHRYAVFVATAIACLVGYWSLTRMRLDATPDLGPTQVIIYSRWERSPEMIESQVTYPIVTAMLGTPHVKTVRGITDFGYSFVYVIFDGGTDLYWARSRTLEYLSTIRSQLPDGAVTEIGSDASSLGWVFQYALVDTAKQHSLAELRSYQEWYLRYYLRSVPGVAEVASIGGFSRQYQVNIDPNRLEAYGIPLSRVIGAVREGNTEASGRLLELSGTEYMIRAHGYAKSLDDFANIVVDTPRDGVPIRVKDLGNVGFGPDIRRGMTDLNGEGDVVSGIVIMRNGESALQVIDRVKARLAEIAPSMPAGVTVIPVYDRSKLINETVDNATYTILEIIVTVVLIILIFLWHFPSAVIPIVTMPVAILLSLIPLRMMGISINVMSLAGIAIAFGELIDASIVVVEQTHKRLEQWERAGKPGRQVDIVLAAVKEVAGPTFFALLVIAVSFLPVLMLEAEEGQMFKPLAYAKTMAMVSAAILAVTLDPALRLFFANLKRGPRSSSWLGRLTNSILIGRIWPEDRHPISALLIRIYEPVVRWTLRWKWFVFGAALLLILATIPACLSLGSEFIPPMDEGTLLYMPTSAPGISATQAARVLQVTDKILAGFPEVEQVLGKAGRADTSTDPAPLSMLETLIILKPRSHWRRTHTWYSSWTPQLMRPFFRHFTPDTISQEELLREMDAALKVPGMSNAWTMPVRGRIDMLTSGIRTPVGLKIAGGDLATIEAIGAQVASALQGVPGTRGVFAERTNQGHFVDVEWNREELARYGISVEQAQQVITNAVGGDRITTVVNGPERYPVNLRYMRDYRDTLDALGKILVTGDSKHPVPIDELATLRVTNGPAMIRDENGLLTGYVYIDLDGRDPGSYIADANRVLHQRLSVPPTYTIAWSGQFEAMQRVSQRLKLAVPLTLGVIILLIYLSTRSLIKTAIVLLAVPFSAIGAIWFLYVLHYNLSVAVWVGLIGLLSIDAETGVFMLLYLDLAHIDAKRSGRLNSLADLHIAIANGAARRLRPKFMTFATTCIGLFPIMWSIGPGSDVMKRIAAPMVGGIFTSFLLELIVYPAIYEVWKGRLFPKQSPDLTGDSSDSRKSPEFVLSLGGD
jgi:Cu(I)/Ag(I) efflux system membrane protein CusA/SilA